MPYHFEFESGHGILLVILQGEVSGNEIREINDGIRGHVARLSPTAGISDFTEVKTFSAPTHDIRAAALQPSPYPEKTPRFIVAPTDYLFGLARMYEIFADRPSGKLKVVRSREEALAALGVRDPTFERLD